MKATQEKEADLGNSSIGKLLFKLALPAILAQIITVSYTHLDVYKRQKLWRKPA